MTLATNGDGGNNGDEVGVRGDDKGVDFCRAYCAEAKLEVLE